LKWRRTSPPTPRIRAALIASLLLIWALAALELSGRP